MGNYDLKETTKHWVQIFIGAILGIGISLPLFKPFFCFYTFQEPLTAFFFAAISVFLWVIKKPLEQKKDELAIKIFYFLIGGMVSATIAMFVTLVTVDLTRNYCVGDFEQLKAMIDMEGKAVINKDINIIHNIYSADAVITRQDTNEAFQAYIFYSQKFAKEDHCNVDHADYLVTDYSRDQVTITTSSMGSYGLQGGEGCTSAYANPPGSDLWVFKKTEDEWKIVHFEFNREVK